MPMSSFISRVSSGRSARDDFFLANEQGSLAVAEAAARNGVKRFVHISSLAAREPGLSMYGASKRAGEVAVEKFKSQMSVIILRPPAVYGPGDRGTLPLLRSLTQSFAVIPGTSTSRFSLIYVDDLARIIVEAAEATRTGTVELDDGQRQGYGWKDLAEIASATEQKSIKPIFLPKSVAMAVGVGVEAIAKAEGHAALCFSRQDPAALFRRLGCARRRLAPERAGWFRPRLQINRGLVPQGTVAAGAVRRAQNCNVREIMTASPETIDQICKLLEPFNSTGKVLTPDTEISADLNIDSVAVMDFVMEVEDHFDIEIPLNVVSETHSIGDLAAVVDARVKKA